MNKKIISTLCILTIFLVIGGFYKVKNDKKVILKEICETRFKDIQAGRDYSLVNEQIRMDISERIGTDGIVYIYHSSVYDKEAYLSINYKVIGPPFYNFRAMSVGKNRYNNSLSKN